MTDQKEEFEHFLLAVSQLSLIILYICSPLLIFAGISYDMYEAGMIGAGILFLTIQLHVERYK